jgi:hypothetical protein
VRSESAPTAGARLKSFGIAIVLTILFGPLGMFYATVFGALVMIVVSALVAVFTLGFGLVLMWSVAIAWAVAAVYVHNEKLLAQVGRAN